MITLTLGVEMKKQIKDLELFEVDYLVAKAEDKKVKIIDDGKFGKYCMTNDCIYSPTTNPAQAWPIIERERINVFWLNLTQTWSASLPPNAPYLEGKSALDAAMRCFVASKFGDEVEL